MFIDNTKLRLASRDEQSGPGTKFFFWPGPGPGLKIFLTRISIKIFSEQDRDQNVFFSTGTVTKIFLTGTGTKICFWRDQDRDQKFFFAGTGTKIFFSPGLGPGPKFFFHRNRDRDQKWLVPFMSTCKYPKLTWISNLEVPGSGSLEPGNANSIMDSGFMGTRKP
jgi:hypothetical protein